MLITFLVQTLQCTESLFFLSMKMKKTTTLNVREIEDFFALAWLPKQKHPCLASLILVQSLPTNS